MTLYIAAEGLTALMHTCLVCEWTFSVQETPAGFLERQLLHTCSQGSSNCLS